MTEKEAWYEIAPAIGTVIGMAIVVVAPQLSTSETEDAIQKHVANLPCMKRPHQGHEIYEESILHAAAIVEGRVQV